MRTAALVLVLAACSGGATKPAPEPETPARFPDLVGTWTARANVPGYGDVQGFASVGRDGGVWATAYLQGASFKEHGQIDAWDGRRLTVSAVGQSVTVEVRHEGNLWIADVPGVGEVRAVKTK